MKKKKVLFVVRDFAHGGIPKCLQQLMLLMDTSKYDVDVYCGDQSADYYILKNCHIIKQDFWMWVLLTNYRKQKGGKYIIAIFIKMIRHLGLKVGVDLLDWQMKRTAKILSVGKYDTCIAFSEGFPVKLVSFISNGNKYAWIHCNYDWLAPSERIEDELKCFEQMDGIVCVSNSAKEAFNKRFPILASKTTVIYNVVDTEYIRTLSECDEDIELPFNHNRFTIVSVGRVCYIKQFEKIPAIARRLLDSGYIFNWYIIGGGPDKEVEIVAKEIEGYMVGDYVELLGPKNNPYTYIRNADLLALTSRSESYPTVINEAKIVETPIISTDFSSVFEIMDDDYGLVYPIDDFCEGIIRIMTDKELYQKLKNKLADFKYDNASLLKQIYALIDNDKK